MSILQVANVHLESSGHNRIQYIGSDTITLTTHNDQTFTFDSSGVLTVPATGDVKRDGVSAFA